MVLFMAAGLAMVAARSGIVATHQSYRDSNVKSATQAAQSGLQVTLYRSNVLQPTATQCVVKDAARARSARRPCRPTAGALPRRRRWATAPATPRRCRRPPTSTSTARFSRSAGSLRPALRTESAARAVITVDAATGNPVFPFGYAMVARDKITFKNDTDINGKVGSNGDIEFKNNTSVCGDITPAPGKRVITGTTGDHPLPGRRRDAGHAAIRRSSRSTWPGRMPPTTTTGSST